jgi:hypothetical protein
MGQSRKLLLTAENWKDGTNRDEPEERDWLEWLKRAQDGVVTQRPAAVKLGVSDRWVRKLLRRKETDGDRVVVHGRRGRSSNQRIDK